VFITTTMPKYTRIPAYAESRGIPAPLLRKWIRDGVVPAIVIKRAILLNAEEVDAAINRFKRTGHRIPG
jgi:hypothetical protein